MFGLTLVVLVFLALIVGAVFKLAAGKRQERQDEDRMEEFLAAQLEHELSAAA